MKSELRAVSPFFKNDHPIPPNEQKKQYWSSKMIPLDDYENELLESVENGE